MQHSTCVELGGRRRLFSSVQAWHCWRLGEMQFHCMLAQCAWCLMHRVSSKNGLELLFFCSDCNEVNPNNVPLLLERAFRWRGCLKRKVMVLHLLLAVMEEFRSQHFSINCCLSVNLFLCLGEVVGSNENSGSVVKEQMMAVVAVIISHLAPMPWSDGWWKREGCSTYRVTVLAHRGHTAQTQFLNRLPAGHLRPQLLYHIEWGKLELPAFEHVSKAFAWLRRAESLWSWLSSEHCCSSAYCMHGAAAHAVVQVVLLLSKLLITTTKTALKCDGMKPFQEELFYSYFPLSMLWQALEFLQTVSGLQPGTLFPNLFSALFLSVMFCFHGNSPA